MPQLASCSWQAEVANRATGLNLSVHNYWGRVKRPESPLTAAVPDEPTNWKAAQ